ncbi:LmeA family phospholipid-binding protein [Streptomyces sp. URMC 127]|uniref:LmeA family phospholipid-binding protein n=1 Tax=Streptomyces sp. URMC 127 TaxID=3423402 RepID=UPI003F1947BF
MPSRPHNPYEELAELADPDPRTEPLPLIPVRLAHPEAEPEGEREPGIPSDTEADDDPWSPPDHRRAKRRRGRSRRRRRSPFAAVPRALKLLIAVLLCGGILVLADRCAQMYAEKKAQQKLQQELHLAAAPQVDIHGFPFLTQVLDKRLQRVDVTVPHVAAERVSLAEVRASARDIRLTGSLPNAIRGAVVGNLDGEVRLSFDDMTRELAASQVRFSRRDDHAVDAAGKLTIAGQELRVRAQARLQLSGRQSLSTNVDDMSLDLPGIATYRPGKGKGLTLHHETAERISRDAARAKALLSVPALAERLGVSRADVATALRSEEELHRLTGAPRFVEALTRVNLVDAAVDHPWLLKKLGIDPHLITALTSMRLPEFTDRLAYSFSLPKEARNLRLQDVRVEKDGIRATLEGVELPVGEKK